MQRVVKWTEGSAIFAANDNPRPPYLGGAYGDRGAQMTKANDLDGGAVSVLELTPKGLENHPDLLRALTNAGRLGRVVSHTHEVVSSHRIWTFVVEF